MASSKIITITDHDSGSPAICTQYYIVKYRISGTNAWQTLSPNPMGGTFNINNLEVDLQYDYDITRVCCSGLKSKAAKGTFNT